MNESKSARNDAAEKKNQSSAYNFPKAQIVNFVNSFTQHEFNKDDFSSSVHCGLFCENGVSSTDAIDAVSLSTTVSDGKCLTQ